ncbi:hypothetical protein P8452_39557 [Trifolium repens]|nr:hypothetical protein P8452_39557 [Trifolium repens]
MKTNPLKLKSKASLICSYLSFAADLPDLDRYNESSVPDSIVSIIQYGEDEIHKSNIKDRVPAQDTNAWDAAEHQENAAVVIEIAVVMLESSKSFRLQSRKPCCRL